MSILTGTIEKIIFRNDNDYYTVALLSSESDGLLTVTGNLYKVNTGDRLELEGSFYEHPKYGTQFKIKNFKTILPETTDKIEHYLASNLLKGVGSHLAKRIAQKFGADTFDILDNNIEALKNIKGIGKKRFDQISSNWEKLKESREAVFFLQSIGLSTSQAIKVYDLYGKTAKNKIEKNPYQLIDDIDGIGFKTADKLAFNLGFSYDAGIRIKAAIEFKLKELGNEGHVCFPKNKLIMQCSGMLKINPDEIEFALDSLLEERRLKSTFSEKYNDNCIYLYNMFLAEVIISNKIKSMTRALPVFDMPNVRLEVNNIINNSDLNLSGQQINALKATLKSNLLVITGGPGTGKTTLIKYLIDIYKELNFDIALCAPTGRAAKRMSLTTNFEAKTIHRLLEYSPHDGSFNKNSENLLDADLVIVDEASMLDMILFYRLLDALKENTVLILVGDVDQIPPIGPGNILKDIISSHIVETLIFNKIFRQAEGSQIILNAHKINNGKLPDLISSEEDDFIYIRSTNEERTVNTILKLCGEYLPSKFGFNPFDDVQVLSPMYKGKSGVTNLNSKLQYKLNGEGEFIEGTSGKFKTGDKVMQIVNNYDKDVFNGDIGKLINYDRNSQQLIIDFYGRPVKYDLPEIDEITLAYAISIHKSQGSEYPVVIIPILKSHSIMLQRKLLYTAITRGKQKVYLIGEEDSIKRAVNNTKPDDRKTLLSDRLADKISDTF